MAENRNKGSLADRFRKTFASADEETSDKMKKIQRSMNMTRGLNAIKQKASSSAESVAKKASKGLEDAGHRLNEKLKKIGL